MSAIRLGTQMIDSFPFAETRIRQLSATRQGRVSIGGFNYQAAYAIARLAAMHASRSVLDLPDLPRGLRYDWAEDLDEVTTSQHFVFTQCKRVSDIGQPSQIARLLLRFAPKLLWTEELQRERVSFRLVCTDTRFGLGPKRISDHLATVEADVLAHGMAELRSVPHERSDRTLWQDLASQYGYHDLLKTLWDRTEVLYVGETALADHPAGPLLPAERSGLDLLLEGNLLNPAKQREALGGLRRLIHSDLITFDPSSEQSIEGSGLSPRVIVPADVRSTLFAYQPPPNDKPPFIVVDRLYLEQQASKPRIPYVARPPDWADVVHGADPIIKFLEREDTVSVTSRVEQELLEPLRRGTDNRLGVLILIGAPGAGKSTLVKRVAAQLIKEGKVLGVDLGVNQGPISPDEVPQYLDSLDYLAQPDRPLLVLMDDPFFANSGWAEFLQLLARPNHQNIAVFGASPTFLYKSYGYTIRGKQIRDEVLELTRPSRSERGELAELYGRDRSEFSRRDEDFLVLAMEAAFGQTFKDIIERIWTTLNGGRSIDPNLAPTQLAWQIRAFLIVCYLHRNYVLCPTELLREALRVRDDNLSDDFVYELSSLEISGGWHIFLFHEDVSGDPPDSRALVGAMHARVAREAWKYRPAKGFDVGEWIIPSSTRVASAIREIAQLTLALTYSSEKTDQSFTARLAREWNLAIKERHVTTVRLCALVRGLHFMRSVALQFRPGLRSALKVQDSQSWLAAVELLNLSRGNPQERDFLEGVELQRTLKVADFSADSASATRALGSSHRRQIRKTFLRGLYAALKKKLDWELDSTLVVWFIQRATSELAAEGLSYIYSWLEDNPDTVRVRAELLLWFERHAVRLGLDVMGPMREMVFWARDHSEDSEVHRQLLLTVGTLAHWTEVPEREVIEETGRWLQGHPEHWVVWRLLFDVASRLTNRADLSVQIIHDAQTWLRHHPEHRTVWRHLLGFAVEVTDRPSASTREIIEDAETWLREHPEHSAVWRQLLRFASQTAARGDVSIQEIVDGARVWLRQHPGDWEVRRHLVAVASKLGNRPEIALTEIIEETRSWLMEHPNDWEVRHQLMIVSVMLADLPDIRVARMIEEVWTWLLEHPEHEAVWRQLFILARKLGPRPEMPFQQIIQDALIWLREHPEDRVAQLRLLRLASSLSKHPNMPLEQVLGQTQLWLNDYPEDWGVRGAVLEVVAELAHRPEVVHDVMEDIQSWLREHPDDSEVRRRLVAVADKIATLLGISVPQIIDETRTWLEDHPNDRDVRLALLRMVRKEAASSEMPLEQIMDETRAWLQDNPNDFRIRGQLVAISEDLASGPEALQ